MTDWVLQSNSDVRRVHFLLFHYRLEILFPYNFSLNRYSSLIINTFSANFEIPCFRIYVDLLNIIGNINQQNWWYRPKFRIRTFLPKDYNNHIYFQILNFINLTVFTPLHLFLCSHPLQHRLARSRNKYCVHLQKAYLCKDNAPMFLPYNISLRHRQL